MTRFAILLGSAPEDFRQKKIEDMFNFLNSKRNKGDSIVTFANGISEMMLELVLDNSMKQLSDAMVEPAETTSMNERHSELVSESTRTRHPEFISESIKEMLKQDTGNNDSPRNGDIRNLNGILLYICTQSPVKDSDKSVWLGGEEIRRDVIEHYQRLAENCGIDMQVVMDSGSEVLCEENLGYERV